jgi:hypothetical protein
VLKRLQIIAERLKEKASRVWCLIAGAASITAARRGGSVRAAARVLGRAAETGNYEFREKLTGPRLSRHRPNIGRVTKVVKGGKNMSFSALVVVGDGNGVVGFGIGKAKEVPSAIKKAIEAAKKALIRVPMAGSSIPHPVLGKFGAGSVLLKPAPDGTDHCRLAPKVESAASAMCSQSLAGQPSQRVRRRSTPCRAEGSERHYRPRQGTRRFRA